MASAGSYKYLYERLGAQRFQQLCAALVVDRFPDVSAFPVGEKDGGRDMISGTGENRTIVQVKWTGSRSRKPASWLKSQITGEAKNIKRLVAEGCKRYILMTNVEGGAAPASGSRDQIEAALSGLSKQYGVPMSCLWASDLDAWVDAAPFEIKMAYVDMLAGTDALLALLRSKQLQDREKRERDMLVAYVGTHWQRDKRVKFRQIDLASDLLTDLFVDVTATRVRGPRNLRLPTTHVGGLAKHLLDQQSPPLTLIEGVPGQGKSTVVQYVCQVHRAGFLGRDKLAESGESCPADESDGPRVAIRIDLADYAEWMSGHDPFTVEEAPGRSVKERAQADIERFLVAHVDAAAPGYEVRIDDIRSVLDRFPTQVVLDGLDEVASTTIRERAVKEIDEFISRWVQRRPGNMRIVVSTRPNASGLAEPSPDIFDRVVLQPLDEATRRRYLRRWANAQHVFGPERRRLEKIFGERTAAPHVSQLADNPMQLTILLHLIRTKGESLPTARTSLYRSYMDLFLEREAAKAKIVLAHRPDLEEATSYIGWLMQALTEVDSASTRLPAQRIIREMTRHLASVGKTDAPVQGLFDAMRDRVWVLTSKQSGTYEFDVQSIREFFAARFLYEYADSGGGHNYEPANALIELLPRAYWANTARFLGGHFQTREVPYLAELVETAFDELPGARQTRTTVWTLLSDGAFKERAPSQKRIAQLFADDLSVRFLAPELSSGTGLPPLPAEFGGRELSEQLRTVIVADPSSPLTPARSIVASAVTDPQEFLAWWEPHLARAGGTNTEAAWLSVGRPLCSGPVVSQATTDRLAISSPLSAQKALAAGVSPSETARQAERLLDLTLAGHCSDVAAEGTSEASDLLRVVAPHVLLTMAAGEQTAGRLNLAGHHVPSISQGQRTAALQRLLERHGTDQLQRALRIKKGEKGTTSRWVNAARALSKVYGGPSWLATEIAAIGAALPATVRTGGDLTPGAPCFGADMDYGQWLPAVRANRGKATWWDEQRSRCTGEDHAAAAWVLGLLVAADSDIVGAFAPEIVEIVTSVDSDIVTSLVATSSRITASGIPRALNLTKISDETPAVARLLLAHYADDPAAVLGEDPEVIREVASFSVGAWPAAQVATRRALEDPTRETVELVVEVFGLGPTESFALDAVLPSETAEHILRHPDRYSTAWLLVADRSLTSYRYDIPLRTHADTQWGI